MRKVLIIAAREYRALVGTKAFLIVLTLMPVLMGGGIVVQGLLAQRVNLDEKRIVVLDRTGKLFDALAQAADNRNQQAIFDLQTGKQLQPRYRLEPGPAGPVTDAQRLQLSQRVRQGEISAFLEIPPDVFDLPGQGGSKAVFYAQNLAFSQEKAWLQGALTDAVRRQRLKEAKIDPDAVDRASAMVMVEGFGLFEQAQGGEVKPAEAKDQELAILLPFGIMMLMFMVVVMAAQPLIESVMEERLQRIAEVLLGSVTPWQLMAGKLLGIVGGSLTIVLAYGLGAWALAAYYDVAHLVPLRMLPWFFLYQVLAVLLFGSVFMAVGACASQLKEAQSMLLPVWLLMMVPMFVWFNVAREPTGSFAMWMSFVPPATPLLMVLRLAASADIPLWQPALGVLILLATTALCVFAAARIFRIGILAQGQTPKLKQMLRWVVSG
jgi:ABC-2 type transport system permease protein